MIGYEVAASLPSIGSCELNREALVALLEAARVLRKEDTGIAGWIRVLSVDGRIVVQEQTPEGTVFARRLPSIEDANTFVNDRLDAYERMWDG